METLVALILTILGTPFVEVSGSFTIEDQLPSVQEWKEIYRTIKRLETEISHLKENMEQQTTTKRQSTVAFTAVNRVRDTFGDGQNIIFEDPIHNVDNNYDPGIGAFTCPASGTYMFSVSIMGNTGLSSNFCIQVGSLQVACSHTEDQGGGNVGSATTAIHCDAGAQVSVKAVTFAEPWGTFENVPMSSFTGVLISIDS